MLECCRIADLRCKEVINICDGVRLGYVCDVVLNICTGHVLSIVVPGKAKFFGLLGREEDHVINWSCIEKIGEDIILVNHTVTYKHTRESGSRWNMI